MEPRVNCLDVTPTTYSTKFKQILNVNDEEVIKNKLAQAIKFYLLKGMCRGGMMLRPQRSVNIGRSKFEFCQKIGVCNELENKYITFYIEQISPFISYTIIQKLKEIYDNKKQQINRNLINIHFVNTTPTLNLTGTNQPRTVFQQMGSYISSALTAVSQAITAPDPNQTKVNQESRKFEKIVGLQLLILKDTITFIPGSFSHERTTNMFGRFFDNFTRNIIHVIEVLTRRRERTLSVQSMKNKLNEFFEISNNIILFKSIFNTLSVGKLLWVDRINPNVLPFYLGNERNYFEVLKNNGYINDECLGILNRQTNRNYVSKFNGLLQELNNYLNPPLEIIGENTPLLSQPTNNLSQPYSIHQAIQDGKTGRQIMDELNERLKAHKLKLIPRTRLTKRGAHLIDYGIRELGIKIVNEEIDINKDYSDLRDKLASDEYKPIIKNKTEGGKKKKSKSTKLKKKKSTKKL